MLAVTFLIGHPASAQETDLVVRLNRHLGYAGFDHRIKGLFTIHAEGPAQLSRLDFYIDSQLIYSDETQPFAYQFTTKDFARGEHRLYAIGVSASSSELRSNE